MNGDNPYHYTMGLAASLDLIPGLSSLNKFGECSKAASGTPTDIWSGADGVTGPAIWLPPTAARVHQLASTSANDTDGGTGARTVRVYYIDAWTGGFYSVDRTLNGLSNVALPSCVLIYRIKCLTWGTGGVNAGVITATAEAPDSRVTAAITTGQNQTQMDIYGVPEGYQVRVCRASCRVVKAGGTTRRVTGEFLYMPDPATNTANNTGWTNRETFEAVEAGGEWERNYEPVPKKFDGPCLFKKQVTSNANDTSVIGTTDGWVCKV